MRLPSGWLLVWGLLTAGAWSGELPPPKPAPVAPAPAPAAPPAAEAASPVTYEVTVNGETFEATEGKEVTVKSKKAPVVEYTVKVTKKRIQTYQTDRLAFDYDSQASLNDDRAAENRTLSILTLNAGSLVITEFGDAPEDGGKAMLALLIEAMKDNFEANKAKELVIAPAAPVELGQSAGLVTTLTYADPDGEAHICILYLLLDEGQAFSVINQYAREDEARAKELAAPTLQTIRGRTAGM
jgi:hypothetical protein